MMCEIFRWWLPPPPHAGQRAKPYLSRWHMDAEEAARRGAIRPEPGTRMVIGEGDGFNHSLSGTAPAGHVPMDKRARE